jgi:SH3-like domain-containing protein
VRDQRRPLALASATLLLIISVSIAEAGAPPGDSQHAAQVSDTPVQIVLPTATETPGPPTETPTRTPTSEGQPVVEALNADTNVRAGPGTDTAALAKIYPGVTYTVIARRFDWFQIEIPEVSGGIGWVYSGVVELRGDETLIPELEEVPTVAPEVIAAQETALAVSATPGGAATLTAQAQITPTGVFTSDADGAATLEPGAPLPTFTSPPYTVTPVIIPRSNPPSTQNTGGVPPIVPILALGALGLMGLLVALLRRL